MTTRELVEKRMQDMIDKRASEIAEIDKVLTETAETIRKASEAVDAAVAATDFDAYTNANAEASRARAVSDMYKRRREQLTGRELISDAESDAVIDSLLDYEKDIAAQYERDIKKALAGLAAVHDRYMVEVEKTEETITRWTSEIHKNYRSTGTTYSDGTNRAPRPVPVHSVAYDGGALAVKINAFLREVRK